MSKIKIFSLGGLNEIGKNMYVIEIDKDILVIDAGLKYADDQMLGIDYVIPNIEYLKENKKVDDKKIWELANKEGKKSDEIAKILGY